MIKAHSQDEIEERRIEEKRRKEREKIAQELKPSDYMEALYIINKAGGNIFFKQYLLFSPDPRCPSELVEKYTKVYLALEKLVERVPHIIKKENSVSFFDYNAFNRHDCGPVFEGGENITVYFLTEKGKALTEEKLKD